MSSSIPIALSLLQTVATTYQGMQKPNPISSSAASIAPPAPAAQPQTVASGPAASAPMNIPGALPLTNGSSAASTSVSPPANTSSNLCDFCQQRPKHNDGTMTHPYCTKSCANKAKLANSSGNCDFCNIRPKYHDGTRTHDYCGRACAASARKPAAKGTCQAPGCQKPAHANSRGATGDYCSMAHKTLAETVCLMCRHSPKMANSNFCSQTCIDDAENLAPTVLEVPVGHVTFKSVAEQFKASWRHGNTACPPVRRVYKIVSSQSSLASYSAYRAAVESRGQFAASGRSSGNENRRWHGTRRECTLGDKSNASLCKSPSCSLCCIIRTSFDLSLWGKKTGWGRFGKGIYTSSTSSKSNDYSSNDCKSPYKAILLNKVVVGKGCKLLHDNTSLTAPPAGFDSVLAEKGGSLNYDELVVYTNDAIRPSFLVMYEL
ncbi:ADP-ribosylation [Pluteus cervinus]|uniref:ADP-ribosylation n=1 Tax=Pluteus cervinus TaxID=181527 RepID=A0ACD3AXG6_9AGAR|nr:ADP-ribosylation [Pluteus cervinus]